MNAGFKYMVVLRDPKGHFKLARVRAFSQKEATTLASEAWPDHTIYSVKSGISNVQDDSEETTRPRILFG